MLSDFLPVIERKADSDGAARHPLLRSARKASERRMTLGEPTSLSTLFSVSERNGEWGAVPLHTHGHGDSVPVAGTMTCLWWHATALAEGGPFRVFRTRGALGTERPSPRTLDVSQLATNVAVRPTQGGIGGPLATNDCTGRATPHAQAGFKSSEGIGLLGPGKTEPDVAVPSGRVGAAADGGPGEERIAAPPAPTQHPVRPGCGPRGVVRGAH